MASRHEESDRENYRRYNDQTGRRYRYEESGNEPYRRGSNAEQAWSEGRGYRSGREDYGSGSWEGEGEAYGGPNRRFQNNLSDEAYGNQRYNYPQGFRSGEREGSYSSRESSRYGGNRGIVDSYRGGSENRGRYGESGYGQRGSTSEYGEGSGFAGFGYGERTDYGERDRYSRGSEQTNYNDKGERHWYDKVAQWLGIEDDDRRRRTEGQRGQHRGRGPKGYKRSDERIREDINDRLSDDDFLDASDIEVQVQESVVILTGSVNDRWDKRRAESIAESVSGVSNVENRLRVGQSSSTSMSTTDQSTATTSSAKSARGSA